MAELDTNIPLSAAQQNPYARINFAPLGDISAIPEAQTQRQLNQAKLSDYYDKTNFRSILTKHQNDPEDVKDQNILNEAQQNGLDQYAEAYKKTFVVPKLIKNAYKNAYAEVPDESYQSKVDAERNNFLDKTLSIQNNQPVNTQGNADVGNIDINGKQSNINPTSPSSDNSSPVNNDDYTKLLAQHNLALSNISKTRTPTDLEVAQRLPQEFGKMGILTNPTEALEGSKIPLTAANSKIGLASIDTPFVNRYNQLQSQYLQEHPESKGIVPLEVNQQILSNLQQLGMRPDLGAKLLSQGMGNLNFGNKITEQNIKNTTNFGKEVEPVRRVSELYGEMMGPLEDIKNPDGSTSPSPVISKILNAQKDFFALAKEQHENIDDIIGSHVGGVGMLAKGAQLAGLIQRYNSSSDPKDQQDANILEHIYRIRQAGGVDPTLDDPDVANFYANYQKFVNRVLHTDDGKRITNPEINLQASSMGLSEFSNPGQMIQSLINYGNDIKGQLDAAKKTTSQDIVSSFSNLPGMDIQTPNISKSGWLNKDGTFKYVPRAGTALGSGNPGGSDIIPNPNDANFHSRVLPKNTHKDGTTSTNKYGISGTWNNNVWKPN